MKALTCFFKYFFGLYYFCFSAIKWSFLCQSRLYRWTQGSNPRQRTMAQTVSPRCSPLDQGASLYCLAIWVRSDMCNIQPAGQMLPTEAFNLAHKAQKFVILVCTFVHKKKSVACVKHLSFSPRHAKKICGPSLNLSWAPLS